MASRRKRISFTLSTLMVFVAIVALALHWLLEAPQMHIHYAFEYHRVALDSEGNRIQLGDIMVFLADHRYFRQRRRIDAILFLEQCQREYYSAQPKPGRIFQYHVLRTDDGKQRARYRMSDWSEPWSIYVTSRADAFGTGRVGLLQLSDRHGHNNTYADLAQYVQPVSWSDFLAFMKDEHVSEWSTVEFLAWLDRTNRSALDRERRDVYQSEAQ